MNQRFYLGLAKAASPKEGVTPTTSCVISNIRPDFS